MGCVSVPVRRYGSSVLEHVGHHNSGRRLATLVAGVERGVPSIILHAALVANFPNRARRRFSRLSRFIGRVGFSELNYFTCSRRRKAPTTRFPSRISRRVEGGHNRVVVRRRCGVFRGLGRSGVNGAVHYIIRNCSNCASDCCNEA